jgi:hypothetical protein
VSHYYLNSGILSPNMKDFEARRKGMVDASTYML